MRRPIPIRLAVAAVLAASCLASCPSNESLVLASMERVTFDLVLEPQTRIGTTVYADLVRNTGGAGTNVGRVSGVIALVPDSTHSHVALTSLEKIATNSGYFLDLLVDMNGNGARDAGDLVSRQYAEVRAGFSWIELRCFESDLEIVA